MPQTNEHAFETYVAEILRTKGRWQPGTVAEWDQERALFPAQLVRSETGVGSASVSGH